MTTAMRPTLALLAALALPMGASADEITDQLKAAEQAYRDGDLRSAIETLNVTVAGIQEQISARLLTLLPEPLEGWQADPAEAQSGGLASAITGTSLSRRYWREDGAEVTLNLMADSPMLPMLTMALSMPFVMQGNPDMKAYSLKGHRGMLDHTAGSREYEITLMVGNRLVIQAEGLEIEDAAPVEQYLQALDIPAIEAALTQ